VYAALFLKARSNVGVDDMIRQGAVTALRETLMAAPPSPAPAVKWLPSFIRKDAQKKSANVVMMKTVQNKSIDEHIADVIAVVCPPCARTHAILI
jgi:hypothetical protein